MAKRWPDKIRKAAIADYIDGSSLREVGLKYSVAPSTVKSWVDADPEAKLQITEKKEQTTKDILQYLDDKVEGYKNFVDYYLGRLNSEYSKESLDQLNEVQLTTIFGVLTDKFLKAKEIMQKQQESDVQSEMVVIRFDVPRD